MYGIETLNSLNRKNAEAEAILAKHASADAAKARAQSAAPHLPHVAPAAKIHEILEGAKG
jgi:hypothetical protein